jgi:membrane protease YdiL (CAAX protease family)
LGVALLSGLPPASVMIILAVNTFAVGFSEEMMFRGVLYRALARRLAFWPAIWITSILFGGIHLLNAFTTGDLTAATLQAITAFMSGVFFLTCVLRTGSILPSMLYHACWDFLLTVSTAGAARTGATEADMSGLAYVLPPLLLILPNFL